MAFNIIGLNSTRWASIYRAFKSSLGGSRKFRNILEYLNVGVITNENIILRSRVQIMTISLLYSENFECETNAHTYMLTLLGANLREMGGLVR